MRNAQANLEPALLCLLENLVELTQSVELIVVDDGSTDATIEILAEMTVAYPQIKVFHFGQPKGWSEAIRTALAESKGQMLFFEEPGCLLPWDQLCLLWAATAKHPVVIGRPTGHGWQRASPWPNDPACPAGGAAGLGTYQLVRRSTLLRLAPRLQDGLSFRQLLLQEGIAWQERILSARPRRQQLVLYPPFHAPESLLGRMDQPQGQTTPPNYLVHLHEDKISPPLCQNLNM